MKTQFLALSLAVMILAHLFILPLVSAEFNDTISPEDKATFDKMLEPLNKIYNFVKYIATFIAVLMLLGAGVLYIASGTDPQKRNNAKNMVMYVVIGLVVIWMAPLAVQFMVG